MPRAAKNTAADLLDLKGAKTMEHLNTHNTPDLTDAQREHANTAIQAWCDEHSGGLVPDWADEPSAFNAYRHACDRAIENAGDPVAPFTVREPGCAAWQDGIEDLDGAIASRAEAVDRGLRRAMIIDANGIEVEVA